MRTIVFCTLVSLTFACSSKSQDDQVVTEIDAGGASSAGSSSTGGSNATGGSTSLGTTLLTGGSAAAGSSSSATGGSTPAGGSSASDSDASSSTAVAGCTNNQVANDMPFKCPVTFKFTSKSFVGKTATFFIGCGPKQGFSSFGWDALCTDVQCSSDGVCLCSTILPKSYWIQLNGQVSGVWAVGAGNGGVVIDYNVYVNDVQLTIDNTVKNPPGNGYNFELLIDC